MNKSATAPQPAVQPEQRVARPLKVLTPLIKKEIEAGKVAAENAAKPFYQRAGELLMEAKVQCGRGKFEPWVRKTLDISPRTAREWMRYAREVPKYQNGTDGADSSNDFFNFFKQPPLSKVTRPDREQVDWEARMRAARARVAQAVAQANDPRIQRELAEKAREQQRDRKLGVELIESGYKALATKLHPDKGGSHEDMVRLQRVHAEVKRSYLNE